MKKILNAVSFTIIIFSLPSQLKAQFSLTGQIRARSEYRNGLGTLKPLANDAAFFISQRSRLTFDYRTSRLQFQTSVQDIRVWGQDASTINNADGSKLAIHEAWGEVILGNKKDSSFEKSIVEYLSIKLGRQELLYDDSRLLGNLDWLQQARKHDAIVLKLVNKGWQVDAGAAFNQNTDAFNYNGTYYTPANVMPYVKDNKGNLASTPAGFIPLAMASGNSGKSGTPALQTAPSTNGLNQNYKSLQYLYLAKTIRSTKISGLLLADQFGKYSIDSVRNISGTDTGYIFGRRYNQKGVNARITFGALVTGILDKRRRLSYTAGAYMQKGRDRDGINLSSYTSTVSLSYAIKKITFTAGWDYLSGNDAFSSSSINHRFDPLYGTPHKFWGYMDYFYAGTGSPAGGLSNPFFKTRYASKNKRFTAALDIHAFGLAKDQKDLSGNAINKYLGNEFDLVTNYVLNKVTMVEWGFSLMAASKSMQYAKGIPPGSAALTSTWSYVMINIRPEFLFN